MPSSCNCTPADRRVMQEFISIKALRAEQTAASGASLRSRAWREPPEMSPAVRLKVLLFFALFSGGVGTLLALLSCGTEYWLLAAEACGESGAEVFNARVKTRSPSGQNVHRLCLHPPPPQKQTTPPKTRHTNPNVRLLISLQLQPPRRGPRWESRGLRV
ncbi:hypothetical protein EYF80_039067 [Liparis tanakae]|uniref:Uncharacterized protein n=1 Tax=Liparis tanakae TaxID=230148 RepID=A0A4Z2GAV3_9TELE|nr:hypothetical protein EYF80_039067 [Liparis tanakae]